MKLTKRCNFCKKTIYIVMSCDKGGYLIIFFFHEKSFKSPLIIRKQARNKRQCSCLEGHEGHEGQDKDAIIMTTHCR